jgi:hypothetical protein
LILCHGEPPVHGIAAKIIGMGADLQASRNLFIPLRDNASSVLVMRMTLHPFSCGQRRPMVLSSSQQNSMTVYFQLGSAKGAGTQATFELGGIGALTTSLLQISLGQKHPMRCLACVHFTSIKNGLVKMSAHMRSV